MSVEVIVIECDGAVGRAILNKFWSGAATAALLEMLPMKRELFAAKWSGEAAVVHPGIGALTRIEELEYPVTSIYPGEIVLRPRGTEILFSWGVAQYRWAVGTDYVTRLAHFTGDSGDVLAAIARTALYGPRPLTIRRG